MVLDKGRVVEFDETSKLLANENSIFYRLAIDHGLITEYRNECTFIQLLSALQSVSVHGCTVCGKKLFVIF